jgi:hypothetical protein
VLDVVTKIPQTASSETAESSVEVSRTGSKLVQALGKKAFRECVRTGSTEYRRGGPNAYTNYLSSLTHENCWGFDSSSDSSQDECEKAPKVVHDQLPISPGSKSDDDSSHNSQSSDVENDRSLKKLDTEDQPGPLEHKKLDAEDQPSPSEHKKLDAEDQPGPLEHEAPKASPASQNSLESRKGPTKIDKKGKHNQVLLPQHGPRYPRSPLLNINCSCDAHGSTNSPITSLPRGPVDAPPLTLSMAREINETFNKQYSEYVHDKQKFGMTLTVKDLSNYLGRNWIEDITINFYLEMVKSRNRTHPNSLKVFAFHAEVMKMFIESNYRYEGIVDETADPDDIFDHGILFFPMHSHHHWSLICVNVSRKELSGYDSLGKDMTNYKRGIIHYVRMEYEKLAARDPNKYPLSRDEFFKDWNCRFDSVPQQENYSDCGIFLLQFAEYLSREQPFDFDQSHMKYFRQRMAFETLKGQLLPRPTRQLLE